VRDQDHDLDQCVSSRMMGLACHSEVAFGVTISLAFPLQVGDRRAGRFPRRGLPVDRLELQIDLIRPRM
jgi:hypothetical protein